MENRENHEIYLDHSATTPVCSEAIEAMNGALAGWYGNPSSLHRKGLEAEKRIKAASQTFLNAIKAPTDKGEILYTSGGTEANNLAISGVAALLRPSRRHIITSAVEHSSVLETVLEWEKRGFEVTLLKPDTNGTITPEQVLEAVRPETGLISLMHVNNETGAIFDLGVNLKGRLRSIRDRDDLPVFHVDAVQSFGKMPIDVRAMGIDLLTASAHKIHGPKGIGFLYRDKAIRLKPLVFGGGQQGGIRPGTENVPGILGMEAAFKALPMDAATHLYALRNRLWEGLASIEHVVINSPADGAPHVINASFTGLKSEVLLHTLEKDGVYVSSGSACHSKDRKSSHVLTALGLSESRIDSALRFSLSVHTTEEDIDQAIKIVRRASTSLGRIMRRR